MDPTLAALLRRQFLAFARKALRELDGTKVGSQPYLKYLAAELHRLAQGDTVRLIINLPPGHLKTQLASVCLTAWLLAHDPSLKIMIVTHAEVLSKTIARNIRSILFSAWFKSVFETRIKKGHAEVTDFGTTAGGGVFVTSFGAGFTGRRADVIIVDDPHDIADDLAQIEKTIETFLTVLLSRLNDRKRGRILVIAHRVHDRDLSAHLLRNDKKWKHVMLPLIATRDQTYEMPAGDWPRRAGDLLRPEIFDDDDVAQLRADNVNPDFEMLYQQDCDFQALPRIETSHFLVFGEHASTLAPVILSIDPGMTNSPRSAYSVVQAWCARDGRYLLLDQFRERCGLAELKDQVLHFRKLYRPVAILIERAANGYGLISLLSQRYGQIVIPVELDGRSKRARFRAHAQKIVDRRIYLPVGAPWAYGFVQEFIEFPNGRHADQIDAATQYLDHADRFAAVQPQPHDGILAVAQGHGVARMLYRRPAGRGVVAAVRGDGRPVSSEHQLPRITIKTEIVR